SEHADVAHAEGARGHGTTPFWVRHRLHAARATAAFTAQVRNALNGEFIVFDFRRVSLAIGAAGVVWAQTIALSGQPTSRARTLTAQEMSDLMVGSSIQASRSSDSAGMIARVNDALKAG